MKKMNVKDYAPASFSHFDQPILRLPVFNLSPQNTEPKLDFCSFCIESLENWRTLHRRIAGQHCLGRQRHEPNSYGNFDACVIPKSHLINFSSTQF